MPDVLVKLNNWAVVFGGSNPYLAPELIRPHLTGEVHGHPNFEDGETIMTSQIMEAEGTLVTTSNTIYSLGNVCPDFARWCEREGIDLDPENPFKIS